LLTRHLVGEIDQAPDAMHEAIKAGGVWVLE
jgi:hypothetical protein